MGPSEKCLRIAYLSCMYVGNNVLLRLSVSVSLSALPKDVIKLYLQTFLIKQSAVMEESGQQKIL